MKRFLVLVLLMTLATAALAQVSTTNPRIIDSTGTAVASHWQEVDFLSSAVRNVVFLNKSTTIALILALRGEDTVASATRYQIQLAAGRTFALGTTQPKVYVKAASGTVAYSVSNGITASLGGEGTSGIVDTLSNRLPASKPRTISDTTLIRPLTGAILYAVGDEMTDTSGTIRTLADAVLTNGGSATIHSIVVVIDSIADGATFRIWPLKSSTPIAADNAVFTFTGDPAAYFTEPISVTVNSSTGSNFSVGSTSFAGVRVTAAAGSRAIPYRVQVMTASTLKLGGRFRIYVNFIYD